MAASDQWLAFWSFLVLSLNAHSWHTWYALNLTEPRWGLTFLQLKHSMTVLGLRSLNCLSVFLSVTGVTPELLKTGCEDAVRSRDCVFRAVLFGLRFKHIAVSFVGWMVYFVVATTTFRVVVICHGVLLILSRYLYLTVKKTKVLCGV